MGSIENGVTELKDVFSDMQTKIAYNEQQKKQEEEVQKERQQKTVYVSSVTRPVLAPPTTLSLESVKDSVQQKLSETKESIKRLKEIVLQDITQRTEEEGDDEQQSSSTQNTIEQIHEEFSKIDISVFECQTLLDKQTKKVLNTLESTS